MVASDALSKLAWSLLIGAGALVIYSAPERVPGEMPGVYECVRIFPDREERRV
jgi:hypothetical protein